MWCAPEYVDTCAWAPIVALMGVAVCVYTWLAFVYLIKPR